MHPLCFGRRADWPARPTKQKREQTQCRMARCRAAQRRLLAARRRPSQLGGSSTNGTSLPAQPWGWGLAHQASPAPHNRYVLSSQPCDHSVAHPARAHGPPLRRRPGRRGTRCQGNGHTPGPRVAQPATHALPGCARALHVTFTSLAAPPNRRVCVRLTRRPTAAPWGGSRLVPAGREQGSKQWPMALQHLTSKLKT